MKKRVLILCIVISVLILELLPYGAVLNFADPEGSIRRTYSYFDMMPFGYANFGPFLTAVMTCVLVIISIIYLFKGTKGIKNAVCAVSGAALLFSVMPLMYGISVYSVVGALISVLLLAVFLISLIMPTK